MRSENYTDEIKELEKYWLVKENNGMLLKEASRDSKCKYYWRCKNDKHIIYKGIHSFIKSKCNYCSGREVYSGENDLRTFYPEITKQWDEVLNKNSNFTPSILSPGSKKSFYWRCSEGHVRERSVFLEVRYNGRCPKCLYENRNNGKFLNYFREDLKILWSSNNIIDFDNISVKSCESVEWLCENNIVEHNYKRRITSQAKRFRAYCPYCEHDLEDLNNSAYSLPFINMWADKSNPKAYSKKSHKIINWKCEEGHDFKKSIKEMTEKLGYACPECRKLNNTYGEGFLRKYFKDKKIPFETNQRILDGLEIDLYFSELTKGIEFNGEHWHSDELIKNKSNGLFINGKDYHQNKLIIAKNKDIDLVFVWAHDLSKHSEELLKELNNWVNGRLNVKDSIFLNRLTSVKDIPCIHCESDRSIF